MEKFKVIAIAILMALSTTVFAQPYTLADLGTIVYFHTLPIKPINKPSNVTVIVTWTLKNGGGSIIGFASDSDIQPGKDLRVPFTGTIEEASKVISTKVALSFYNGHTGATETFPGFVALVTCMDDFGPRAWWFIQGPPPESKSKEQTYTITQTTTEP